MGALGICGSSLGSQSTWEPQGNSCPAVAVSGQQAGGADQGAEQVLPEPRYRWPSRGDK